MEKQNFSAVVSGLSNYIDQIGKDELILAVEGSAPSIGLFAQQGGVNAPTKIHLMDLTTSFQNGLGCGLTDNTTVTFTDRELTPAFLKSELVYCDDDFRKVWIGHNGRFNASNHEDGLRFEKEIVDKFVGAIGENLEDFVWNGGTINSVTYKGFKNWIVSEGKHVYAGTTADIYDKVVALIKGLPKKSLKKSEIFMGEDDMMLLKEALLKKDFRLIDLNYTNGAGEVEEHAFKMPVFGIVVREVTALNGTGAIVAGVPEHMVYGYSVDGADSDVEYIYDSINRRHIFRARLVACTNVAYVGETAYVTAENAPAQSAD